MKNETLCQAMSYFGNKTAFKKLFGTMRRKYKSLGHFGGKYVISDFSADEIRQVEGFLGKNLGKTGTITVTYNAMEKALMASRFSELKWEDVLEEYFGEKMSSNKEERAKETELKAYYWESIIEKSQNVKMKEWLIALRTEKMAGYRVLEQQYREDEAALREVLYCFENALDVLQRRKNDVYSLPIFAAKTTGNPHYFDDGTLAGRLLYNYAEYYYGHSIEKDDLNNVERKEQLLYQLGIAKDDISNTCVMYGVCAYKEDGSEHRGIQGYYKEKQPLDVTLRTLAGLVELRPGISGINDVYVLENPAVFSFLISCYPNHTFICTKGQIKLAGYMALDLFPDRCHFFYAGDFDPEGLQIAQKLKMKYKERLHFWNYEGRFYEEHLSDVLLDEKRLKKLDSIHDEGLAAIKECMMLNKRAAYQESMLEIYKVMQ